MLVALSGFVPAGAGSNGSLCHGDEGFAISGDMQELPAHVDLFTPAYYGVCPSSARTAPVDYNGSDDNSYLVATMSQRTPGTTVVALGRPLSPSEKVEMEAYVHSGTTCLQGACLSGPGNYSFIDQIPLLLQPLSIIYNLPCASQPLKLSSPVLSDIFLGAVTSWNSPLLTKDNPDLAGCNLPVILSHDYTEAPTYALYDYLSQRNPHWTPYKNPQLINTPVASSGCAVFGGSAMADCVAAHPGSIGYAYFNVLAGSNMPVAFVDNPAGQWSQPSLAGCTAAAASNQRATPPVPLDTAYQAAPPASYPVTSNALAPHQGDLDWSQTTVTDSTTGYPLCSFSFAMVYQSLGQACQFQCNTGQVQGYVDYMTVALSDKTQASLSKYGFAPLPQSVLLVSRDSLSSLSF